MIAPCPGISRGIDPTVPDGARIGERNRGAFKIGDGQLVGARARHQIVIGGQELREVHRLRVLDRRDFERARAVLARDVHRDSQVHVLVRDAEGLRRRFPNTPDSAPELFRRAFTMAHATRCV